MLEKPPWTQPGASETTVKGRPAVCWALLAFTHIVHKSRGNTRTSVSGWALGALHNGQTRKLRLRKTQCFPKDTQLKRGCAKSQVLSCTSMGWLQEHLNPSFVNTSCVNKLHNM